MLEGNCRHCGRYFTPYEEQSRGTSFNYTTQICALCAPSVCDDCAHDKAKHATWCKTEEILQLKRNLELLQERADRYRFERDTSIAKVRALKLKLKTIKEAIEEAPDGVA